MNFENVQQFLSENSEIKPTLPTKFEGVEILSTIQ